MRKYWVASFTLLAVLGFTPKAMAHAVQTDYAFNDEGLEFISTFSTGEPVQEAEVFVYSPDNPDEPWATGFTDEQGRFTFLPDESVEGDWEIRIQQDLGHGDILTIPVTDTGIDIENISEADRPLFAVNPLLWAGGLGLGTCMAIAAYASRKSETE